MNIPPTPPRPMQKKYLTVENARKLMFDARDLNGEFKRQETEAILECIHNIATCGNDTYTTKILDPIVRKRIETLGYTVKVTMDQRDGSYTTISW